MRSAIIGFTPLHHAYREATTATFAGIVACQIGTAFASRTESASLREVGPLTNPLLLWGTAFEVAFTAALIYVPPLQQLFGTAALGPATLAVIAPFPFAVWGLDELRRLRQRHRHGQLDRTAGHMGTGRRRIGGSRRARLPMAVLR